MTDDEFPLAALDLASDERAVRQNLNRLDDLANSLGGILHVEPSQVVEDPIKVAQDFRRNLDSRHS